jgi:hypothetical protein
MCIIFSMQYVPLILLPHEWSGLKVLSIETDPAVKRGVITLWFTFESKTSCDLDGISTKLLKHIISEICLPLAHIFNLSTSTGIFPSMLKTSRTVPIFKAGPPLLCDNYRPISLLSTLSKLLEKIVCRQLVAHLEDNNLIYDHQYDFQHSKSTKHNFIQITNYIHTALTDKKNTQLASS